MFLDRLMISTLFCCFFLHHSIFTFASNSYFPVDKVAVDNYGHLDNNLASPYPVSPQHAYTSPTPKQRKLVSVFGRGNTIATGVIIMISILSIIVYKLRELQEANFGEELNILSTSSSGKLCRRFSLAEIKWATHNFDDAMVIGRGGFGKVYKGLIDNGAHIVAIKRLNPMSKQGAHEFWTEIEIVSMLRHSNLVSLIGYCDNHPEMILVYEYMVRGTIADHLHKIGRNGNSPLSWVQRLKICIDAARGLDYLHTGTGARQRVIHRDVKSTNILLDENWTAKISDFGMSKIGPANQECTHVSTNVKGTFGYMDPEYFLTHRLTRKSDVYSFGVVMFEVLCGRSAVDLTLPEEECVLARWARQCMKEGTIERIIDPSLRWQILSNSSAPFAKIADQCLCKHPKKRPTMAEVVAQLEFALALQEKTDSSVVEWDIMDTVRAYDNQEKAKSSTEQQEVTNPGNDGHHEEKIDGTIPLGDVRRPKRNFKVRTFLRKVFDSKDEKPVKKKVKDVHLEKSGASSEFKAGENKSENSTTSVESGMHSSRSLVILSSSMLDGLTLENLLQASAEVLGKGKLGSLYKATLKDGLTVAVKRLRDRKFSMDGFKKRMQRMQLVQHPYVLPAIAYHCSKDETLLLYEYQENGSLFRHLQESKKGQLFNWGSRLSMAASIAKALEYLHDELHNDRIAHGDLKSSNILLNKDMDPCISEYGLIDIVLEGQLFLAKNNFEGDIYSFGVILLELLTGKLDQHNGFDLVKWVVSVVREEWTAEVFDIALISSHASKERMADLLDVALQCITSLKTRPSITEIAKKINSIKEDEERSISPKM